MHGVGIVIGAPRQSKRPDKSQASGLLWDLFPHNEIIQVPEPLVIKPPAPKTSHEETTDIDSLQLKTAARFIVRQSSLTRNPCTLNTKLMLPFITAPDFLGPGGLFGQRALTILLDECPPLDFQAPNQVRQRISRDLPKTAIKRHVKVSGAS